MASATTAGAGAVAATGTGLATAGGAGSGVNVGSFAGSERGLPAGAGVARGRGQQIVVTGDRDGQLLDQHAQFVDLAHHGLDAVGACGVRRHHPAFDGSEPAAEFGDLAGEVGRAAGQVGDLAADIGAVAQPHRHGVVEDQEGQRGQRHDRGFGTVEARHRMQHESEGCCEQHHADGDENRRNANHVARYALRSELTSPGKGASFRHDPVCAPPSAATLPSMLIRTASVLSTRPEPDVP